MLWFETFQDIEKYFPPLFVLTWKDVHEWSSTCPGPKIASQHSTFFLSESLDFFYAINYSFFLVEILIFSTLTEELDGLLKPAELRAL